MSDLEAKKLKVIYSKFADLRTVQENLENRISPKTPELMALFWSAILCSKTDNRYVLARESVESDKSKKSQDFAHEILNQLKNGQISEITRFNEDVTGIILDDIIDFSTQNSGNLTNNSTDVA